SHWRARPRPATVLTTASSEPRPGWDLEGLRSDRCQRYGSAMNAQADLAINGTVENSVPSVHIRCGIVPMRLAKATIARFAPRRLATCAAQLRSHVERPRWIMTVAAWHKALRRLASPSSRNAADHVAFPG